MSKKPLKVPEYFKDLPDDANLNSRDVAAIFGLKRVSSIWHPLTYGINVPCADIGFKCGSVNAFSKHQHGTKHVFWKVKTIREWIENHQ